MAYNLQWLTDRFDKGETLKFIFFWGHTSKDGEEVGKFIFSQWYPFSFIVDGVEYRTAEHWMMAQKAILFGDDEIYQKVVQAVKPGEVKELGRKIRGFDEIIWNDKKYEIVVTGNIHKFNQNSGLAEYLVNTGDRIIVEASPVDTIWAIGLPKDAAMIDNPYSWRGENLLGFALMEVRDFLKDFGHFNYDKNEIVPPWKKYPDIDAMDMFWRMGKGDQYLMEHENFFQGLSTREKKVYQLSYPPPASWLDFY